MTAPSVPTRAAARPPCVRARRRGRRRLRAGVVAGTVLGVLSGLTPGLASRAGADDRSPRVGYVFPAGGRQGTTFSVVVGGLRLAEASDVRVTGEGVVARVVGEERPLTGREQQTLRERLLALQAKRRAREPLTDAERAEAERISRALARFGPRPLTPALAEAVLLEVTVAPDAPLGRRELRVLARAGLSNPMGFVVGDLPEESEARLELVAPRGGADGPPKDRAAQLHVTLPVTVNGQLPPGGVDRLRFFAAAGRRIVVDVRARALVPYVADAVPGWCQATAAVLDERGREVVYLDDDRHQPDPLLVFEAPRDGEYTLELRDALYRGREDFVYRATLGEVPVVRTVFPLGGRAGEVVTLSLGGWNLRRADLALDLTTTRPGRLALGRAAADLELSDRVRIEVGDEPEVVEREPNDARAAAQRVKRPVVVHGRIDAPGDVDVFRFDTASGETVVAEILARRLGSPLDARLVLRDAFGKEVASGDDAEDRGEGLATHHADPCVVVPVRTAGAWLVEVHDTVSAGGPGHAYRLRIGPPRPDFALRAVPSAVNVRAGGSEPLTVHVLRRDGFAGEIEVALLDPPPGVTLSGGPIAADATSGAFTVSAPPTGARDVVPLRLVGRARVRSRLVERDAVPADDRMQAFAYRHLVPADELLLCVVGRARGGGGSRVVSETPLRVPAGGLARVEVEVPSAPRGSRLTFEGRDAPDGLVLRAIEADGAADGAAGGAAGGRNAFAVSADPARIRPGTKGVLVVEVFAVRPPSEGDARPGAGRRQSLGVLPAIPFEVVKR